MKEFRGEHHPGFFMAQCSGICGWNLGFSYVSRLKMCYNKEQNKDASENSTKGRWIE